jgi:hypothetical protein
LRTVTQQTHIERALIHAIEMPCNTRHEIRKIFAVLGALITGEIGITVVSFAPQAAEAAFLN